MPVVPILNLPKPNTPEKKKAKFYDNPTGKILTPIQAKED